MTSFKDDRTFLTILSSEWSLRNRHIRHASENNCVTDRQTYKDNGVDIHFTPKL